MCHWFIPGERREKQSGNASYPLGTDKQRIEDFFHSNIIDSFGKSFRFISFFQPFSLPFRTSLAHTFTWLSSDFQLNHTQDPSIEKKARKSDGFQGRNLSVAHVRSVYPLAQLLNDSLPRKSVLLSSSYIQMIKSEQTGDEWLRKAVCFVLSSSVKRRFSRLLHFIGN